jgi:hypothetical protein
MLTYTFTLYKSIGEHKNAALEMGNYNFQFRNLFFEEIK